MNLNQINQHFISFIEFYNNHYDQSYPISDFWKNIFNSRENFPKPNSLINFQRGHFLTGVGKDNDYSEIEEKKIWDNHFKLVSASIPSEHIAKFKEPIIGSPLFYTNELCTMSASYLINTITSYTIEKLSQSTKNLNLAEIGPGWGAAAEQIIQSIQPNLYYIIDLPQNLLLSSYYLTHSHPKYSSYFSIQENSSSNKRIIYSFPNMTKNISEKFDIILNSFSFQEMETETVTEYLNWAHENLKDNGILVSINSHGKTSVQKPSDYYHPGLNLVKLDNFRKSPSALLNTVPYLSVFKKEPATYSTAKFNLIGNLSQLGINITLMLEKSIYNAPINLTTDVLHILKLYYALNNKTTFLKLWAISDFSNHQFAYLKLNTFACVHKYLPKLENALVKDFLWLEEECMTLISSKPKKSLSLYLKKILSPFNEEIILSCQS